MNAPANIPQRRRIRVDESAMEASYRRAISVHLPNEDEMAMAARVDIARLRDKATAGLSRVGESTAVLLSEVARLGMAATFAPASASRLIRIKAALTLTMMAARELERVERDG